MGGAAAIVDQATARLAEEEEDDDGDEETGDTWLELEDDEYSMDVVVRDRTAALRRGDRMMDRWLDAVGSFSQVKVDETKGPLGAEGTKAETALDRSETSKRAITANTETTEHLLPPFATCCGCFCCCCREPKVTVVEGALPSSPAEQVVGIIIAYIVESIGYLPRIKFCALCKEAASGKCNSVKNKQVVGFACVTNDV